MAVGHAKGVIEAKADRPAENGGRSCGDCTACCVVFKIDEVNKPMNESCRHMCSSNGKPGCRIYAHRPQVCRDFECAWKLGLAGDWDRPDRLGVLFYTVDLEDGEPGLAIVEVKPGAFETKRVKEMIELYRERKPGRIILRRAEEMQFHQARPAVITIEGRSAGVVARAG